MRAPESRRNSSLSSIRSKWSERKTRVHFLRLGRRYEISPVNIALIAFAFHKDRAEIVHKIFLHLVIEFNGNAAEPICDIPV